MLIAGCFAGVARSGGYSKSGCSGVAIDASHQGKGAEAEGLGRRGGERASERDRRHPDEKSRHLLTQLVLLAFVCIDVVKTYD